jgi:putative aldouronate transport system permease protein
LIVETMEKAQVLHPTKKPSAKWRKAKKYWVLYLFLLPAVVWFFVFCYVPIGGLVIVFKDYSFSGGILGSPFVSPFFKNFELFFNMPTLWSMVKNTFLISFLKILLFPCPIILALQINEVKNKPFKSFVQTTTSFPFFISWVIVTTMLDQLLTPYGSGGPLYRVLQTLSGSTDMTFYLVDEQYFIPTVLLSYVWKTVGWNSIIYLAAISNINPELYDAAKIDGVGRFQMQWYVILPELLPVIGLLFIMSLGSILSAGFEQIYFLQTPSNYGLSNVLDVFVVTFGIEKGKYALASIANLFQGLIGLLFIVGGNSILKKTSDISLW